MFGLLDGGGLSVEDAARLRRMERKLDAVMAHLGLTDKQSYDLSDAARRFADEGQKIAAIKQYRDDTGAGLAEAKDKVEEYLRRG